MKFTQPEIDALPTPEKEIFLWDPDMKRFGLRMKPSGKKTYMIQYRNTDQISRKKSIGDANSIKLKDARNLARQHFTQIASGIDPAEEVRVERAAWTVADLVDYWRDVYVPSRKLAAQTIRDNERFATQHVVPAWGKRKVKDISKGDVMRLQGAMSNQPNNANRCLAFVSKLMNLAVEAGELTANPVQGIERYPENKRERYLNVEEINRVFDALKLQSDQNQANCIRLIMLTGCRRSEAFSAEWSQFNLQAKTWALPLSNTKQRKLHNRQLSDHAVNWLTSHKVKQDKDDIATRWLFPQKSDSEKHIADIKKFWAKVLKEATIDECRIHDLRHTFASLVLLHGDNVSIATIGALLGHQNLSTTMRYAHIADQAARSAVGIMGALLRQS